MSIGFVGRELQNFSIIGLVNAPVLSQSVGADSSQNFSKKNLSTGDDSIMTQTAKTIIIEQHGGP